VGQGAEDKGPGGRVLEGWGSGSESLLDRAIVAKAFSAGWGRSQSRPAQSMVRARPGSFPHMHGRTPL
jgi:hypothetical protein